jgi:cellobiose phosphorylase
MATLWEYNAKGECVVPKVERLPQPLIHMLANCPQYFSICDQYLRGYSGFDYTRMFGEFDGPHFPKGNGRFLWFRSAAGKTWLANNPFTPAASEGSFTMGMGYVTFENRNKAMGLAVKATVFVPLQEMAEIMLVEVTNSSTRPVSFDFIPTVPIFGGSRAYTEYHRDVVRLYNKSRITDHIEICPGLEWVEGKTDASAIAYFMTAERDSGKKGDRFYSDRESFLGPRHSWAAPDAIINNHAPQQHCFGKEAVGAIEFRKISLRPGATARFVVVTGIAFDAAQVKKTITTYSHAAALSALQRLQDFWRERTSRVIVGTGNPTFDILWNTWWCYQLSMRYWFGNTGHPQFDYGSDFAGWRDFWQDMMAATVIDPVGLEQRTLHTLEGIRLDGTNATRFFARTKEFGSDELNGLWCDHPYWTTQTVLLLIRFLGDVRLLVKDGIAYFKDAYRDRGETKDDTWPHGHIERQKTTHGAPYTGTVLEHLLAQLLTMFYDVGTSNLLRQKRADWNDAVDQVKGENVTFTLGLAQDFIELADFLEEFQRRTDIATVDIFEEIGMLIEERPEALKKNISVDTKHRTLNEYLARVNGNISGNRVAMKINRLVTDMRSKAAVLVSTVNGLAWNGEYYTGYFHADGTAVDTIFKPGATRKKHPASDDFEMMLMPQTWALLSNAADQIGVTEQVLSSINKHLLDKNVGALKLNYPAYEVFNKNIGRITGFAAGTKENNAVFCHANLFLVWALLRRRRADEAYRIFSGIVPLSHPQEIQRTGPWIPEYYISSDNPNWPSRGEYPLLTASAGWARFVMQNFFFGVRGELDGLRIDPCLPQAPEFRNASLSIMFRGARYHITFKNPGCKKNTRLARLVVDGEEIPGNLVPAFRDGEHSVIAELAPEGGCGAR